MRRCMLFLAAAAVLACEGEDTIEPQDRVIATGSYQYEGRWLHPETLAWDTVRGELVLDVVTPDSVHGHWVIGGYRSDSTGGYWNENAYVVPALSMNGRLTLTHRLSRIGSAAQLLCALSYREDRPNALEPIVTSGTCTVAAQP